MKRFVLALGLIVLVASAVLAESSVFYPVRVDVVKVWSHADGFRVVYRKGTAGFAEAWIPIAWFVPGGKGDLVRANDASFPYLTVYYKEGKFSHVRLYVKADQRDPTWGVLPPDEGKGKFSGFEEIKLQF